MKTLREPAELASEGRPVALAIGVFDGVHLGHQEVIRRTVAAARRANGPAVVATFDRHPNAVVAPDRTPLAILPTSLRLQAFAELGVDAAWLIRFDEAFSRQTGEEFVRRLVAGFGRVAHICVGRDFHFGWRRSGDVDLLRRLGAELGFTSEAVPPQTLAGHIISSTGIRELIRRGALAEAARWLGRPYRFAGPVIRGDGLGRQLGFPTANLDVTGLQLPPGGVYAAWVQGPDDWCPAVMNIGTRPTVTAAAGELRVELHLLGRDCDLYGRELVVQPVCRLRAEQRFASLEDLKAQIARDIAACRAVLVEVTPPSASGAVGRPGRT